MDVAAKEAYRTPSVVDLRVPVPRRLAPRPIHEAKEHRRLTRALVSSIAGLVLSAMSSLGAYVLMGDRLPLHLWAVVAAIVAFARIVVQLRIFKGEISRSLGFGDEVMAGLQIASSGTMVGIVASFLIEAINRLQYPRGLILADWGIAIVVWVGFLVVAKMIVRRLRLKGWNTRQVLVLGSNPVAHRFSEQVARHPETGFRMAGVVPYHFSAGSPNMTDSSQTSLSIEARDSVEGSDEQDLIGLISGLAIDDIVLARPLPRHQIIRLLAYCPETIRLRQLPPWADVPAASTDANLAGFPVLDPLLPANRPSSLTLKRYMDISISALALLLAFPLITASAFLIRLTSPGPAIFRQVRIGQHGRRFTMYKLRTMRLGIDPSVHEEYVRRLMDGTAASVKDHFKLDQPEITMVGRWLRRLSIDELPQLWNVLKGDMSLVGPRPPMPYEISIHDSRQIRRLDVKPGATGLWQVSARNGVGYREMVEMDLDYIKRWSLVEDLKIVLKTPLAAFRDRATA